MKKRTGFLLYYVIPLAIFFISIFVTQAVFRASHVQLFRNFFFSLLLIAIPAVLLYLVGLAIARVAGEIRRRKLGSRFQARILSGFFAIVVITIVPLIFFLNRFFFEKSFGVRFVEDLNQALTSAYELSRDHGEADHQFLRSMALKVRKFGAEDWKAAALPAILREASLSFCGVFRGGKSVFSWSDTAGRASLLTPADLREYDLNRDLFVTKTRKADSFMFYIAPLTEYDPPEYLVLARQIDSAAYKRSQTIEKGYLLYRQINLLQKPYRQALSILMADFVLFVILLALIFSILLARQISKPVIQIYEGIQNIASGRLDFYIEYPHQDEMKVLIQAFNNMTKELFFNQQAVLHSQHIEAWKQIAVRQIDELRRQSAGLVKTVRKSVDDLEDMDPRKPELADIHRRIQDLDKIILQFESFTAVPKLTLRKENLNEVIREVMEIFEGTRANISFFVELDNSIPLVNVNRAQLYQALVNLVKNAIEAIPRGMKGLIKIRTESMSNLKGGFVKLEVIDNGTGILPDLVSRIWEPYFSTKKNKQGLGLTIVKRIVEEHDARITCRRIDGRTVFTVEFSV